MRIYLQYTQDFCIFSLENRNTSESRENHKTVDMLAGVRPQSKVAGDCTFAPDPGGCALSEGLSEEGASSEEGERRKEERGTTRNESVLNKWGAGMGKSLRPLFWGYAMRRRPI